MHSMHGYLVLEHFESRAAMPITFKKPTVYNMLSKMKADGWVVVREEQEGKRPPRSVYEITEAGEAAFQSLLRDEVGSYTEAEFPSVVSLAFLDLLPRHEAKVLLEQRHAQIEDRLREVNASIGELDMPIHAGSALLPLRYLQRHYMAEMELLEDIIKGLSEIE